MPCRRPGDRVTGVTGGVFTPAARAAILNATLGRCAGCGSRDRIEVHHRRPRGTGGTSNPLIGEPFNGVALCSAHHARVETRRDQARLLGWLTPNPDPGHPFWTRQWGWCTWLLLTDGDPCWCITPFQDPPTPAAADAARAWTKKHRKGA